MIKREASTVKVNYAVQCQDAHFEYTESDLLDLLESPYFKVITLNFKIRLDYELDYEIKLANL